MGSVEGHTQGDVEARRLYARVTERLFGEPSAPVRIGRYRVEGRLGSGAMGVVYSAVDERLGRRLAIKLLHESFAGDPTGRARLLREAQAMARLRHENVVLVYDVGTHGVGDEQVFIAMELVEGRTLDRWLRETPHLWQDVLARFLQAGRALAAAHRAGVLHRDFKPENVLVDAAGRVRVLDFGLARALAGPAEGDPADSLSEPLTRTGSILGTPAYMAPEQLRGEPTDARADQFSFCVALYEALYGARPFASVARFAPVEVSHVPKDSKVPAHLRRALLRGLADAPGDRHADMDALLAALDPRGGSLRVVAASVVGGLLVIGGVALGLSLASSLAVRPGLDLAAARHAITRAAAAAGGEQARQDEASHGARQVRDSRRAARFHPLLRDDPTAAALLLRELPPDAEGLASMRRQVLAQPLTLALLAAAPVRALWFDRAGDLWIAGATGAQRLDRAGVRHDEPAANGPPPEVAPAIDPAAGPWRGPDGKTVLRRDPHGRLFLGRRWLRQHEGEVTAIAWSRDGELVAVAGEPQVHVWDRRGELRGRLAGHEGLVRALAWSPTGDRLLCGADDGRATVLPIGAPGRELRVLRGHTGPISALAWDDGERVATASADGSVRLWSLVPGARLRLDHPGAVQALAWRPDGQALASGAEGGAIRLFALADPDRPKLAAHGRSVMALAWSPDGSRLASAGGDTSVRVWSAGGELLHELPTGGRRGEDALAVAWTASGDLLAAGNGERVLLWSAGQGPARPVAGPRAPLLHLALHPEGRELATGSVSGAARRWTLDLSAETPALVERDRLEGEVNGLVYCADGTLLLARDDRRVDQIAPDGTVAQRRTGAAATSVACDPGLVVAGLADGRIRLWSRSGGPDPADLAGHTAAVEVLAFSPAGDLLASADSDGHLYVWPWTDDAIAAQLGAVTRVCLDAAQREALLDEPADAARQAAAACNSNDR